MTTSLLSSTNTDASLVHLLHRRAADQGTQLAYRMLLDDRQELQLSYGELDRRARALAAHLQELGATGQRALLLYQPGFEYIIGLFGCLYAGVVAVPAFPPSPTRLARGLSRLQVIVENAQARFALTSSAILALAEPIFTIAPHLAALTWVASDTVDHTDPEALPFVSIDGSTLAMLQYTSGSTGNPNGVMLTHGNLLSNLDLIRQAFAMQPDDIGMSWLPPYHDMGMIGGILEPLYLGIACVLMSPLDFLQRPIRWLRAISHFGVTVTGGPNFAYELCVNKTTPEQRAELDLSSWRLAFNGAEPVRHKVIERFNAAFASSGFRPEAMYPCYGLAEATLLVSGGDPTQAPPRLAVQAAALESHRVIPASPDAPGAVSLVSCGSIRAGQQLEVVDPATLERCAPGSIGEIWLAGASIAQGYWKSPPEAAARFQGQLAGSEATTFLRTGDLGFMHDNDLYVTGRLKDLIIIDGRNHYPQDIELSLESCHPALRPGCIAAFSVEVDGQERLVVAAEVERGAQTVLGASRERDALIAAMRKSVAEQHDLRLYDVVLLKRASIPKTSSGKIQRHACRTAYLQQIFEPIDV